MQGGTYLPTYLPRQAAPTNCRSCEIGNCSCDQWIRSIDFINIRGNSWRRLRPSLVPPATTHSWNPVGFLSLLLESLLLPYTAGCWTVERCEALAWNCRHATTLRGAECHQTPPTECLVPGTTLHLNNHSCRRQPDAPTTCYLRTTN